jgi:hypothetical protein
MSFFIKDSKQMANKAPQIRKAWSAATVEPGHFELKAKILVRGFLVFIGLILVAGFVVPWLLEQVAIDRCLDAGGRFDYQSNICAGVRDQKDGFAE